MDARTVFHGLTNDPFVHGCVQELPGFSFPVSVKMTCGAVNKRKCPVAQREASRAEMKVVYPDASVKNGWISKQSATVIESTAISTPETDENI